jgi:cytochrome c oxidase subunit 2
MFMVFRGKGMPTAIILVLVALGSVMFHLLSPWWWTPIASNWGYIDDTIIITFWITGVVFTAIILFMAYCVFRFRHQPGRRAVYDPENKKLEWGLSIVTAVGVGAMLAPGLFVWNQFITVPQGASEVEVIGRQWQWSFRLPGEDGRLGTSDIQYVSSDNPLGLNPNDPDAHDDVVIEADDLHSFYVPEFRAKMDLVPGMVTYVWFTPIRTGTFEMLCTELCGAAHYNMRAKVVVMEQSEYQAWLRKQKTFAQLSARTRQAKETQ